MGPVNRPCVHRRTSSDEEAFMQGQPAVQWRSDVQWPRDEPETVRSVAGRLERYFDWYARVDPDVPGEAVQLVARFFALAHGRVDRKAAKQLLEESGGFSLGSPWEELRVALRTLARS
jgi:hypothetical protein